MPIQKTRLQAAIRRMRSYPADRGEYWGTVRELEGITSEVALALAEHPGLVRYG